MNRKVDEKVFIEKVFDKLTTTPAVTISNTLLIM